jgi:dephospho-CoA kinase
VKRKMKLIGILGGIGSGKSLVASELARLGAVILDGDRVGHLVLEEKEVRDALRQRWGNAIFREDGTVNRREIATIVFGDAPDAKAELAFLEGLTHTRIGTRLFAELDRLRQEGRVKLVVLDAPVMTKTGWHKKCSPRRRARLVSGAARSL